MFTFQQYELFLIYGGICLACYDKEVMVSHFLWFVVEAFGKVLHNV